MIGASNSVINFVLPLHPSVGPKEPKKKGRKKVNK